jgi:hypothetical protein
MIVPYMLLGPDQMRTLAVLDDSPDGEPVPTLLAQGFRLDMLTELVLDGFAIVKRTRMSTYGRMIKVAKMHITAKGRRALAGS